MTPLLDDIDVKILNHLQEQGRAQRNKIAELVGLSVPSVSERMKKLEERGLIQGYHAILNDKDFHFDISAFLFVQVDGSEHYNNFVEETLRESEILECHSITGEGSHLLKVRTKNTASFEQLLSRIQSWVGVDKTRSNLVLSSFKETRSIPIEQSTELLKR